MRKRGAAGSRADVFEVALRAAPDLGDSFDEQVGALAALAAREGRAEIGARLGELSASRPRPAPTPVAAVLERLRELIDRGRDDEVVAYAEGCEPLGAVAEDCRLLDQVHRLAASGRAETLFALTSARLFLVDPLARGGASGHGASAWLPMPSGLSFHATAFAAGRIELGVRLLERLAPLVRRDESERVVMLAMAEGRRADAQAVARSFATIAGEHRHVAHGLAATLAFAGLPGEARAELASVTDPSERAVVAFALSDFALAEEALGRLAAAPLSALLRMARFAPANVPPGFLDARLEAAAGATGTSHAPPEVRAAQALLAHRRGDSAAARARFSEARDAAAAGPTAARATASLLAAIVALQVECGLVGDLAATLRKARPATRSSAGAWLALEAHARHRDAGAVLGVLALLDAAPARERMRACLDALWVSQGPD